RRFRGIAIDASNCRTYPAALRELVGADPAVLSIECHQLRSVVGTSVDIVMDSERRRFIRERLLLLPVVKIRHIKNPYALWSPACVELIRSGPQHVLSITMIPHDEDM